MAYVHNLDPFAIQFTEHFGIRWYGLAYLAGFISAYYIITLLSRRGGTLITGEAIADFITYGAIGVLAGGRLGYCLFYAPDLFWTVDSHFPYWGVLKVNEGGMASHGGIIGVMLVCFFYARRNKLPILHVIDLTAIAGACGFFFGRIANFINGELYGREAPADLSWAVKFPSEMSLWVQNQWGRLVELKPAVDALGEMKLNGQTVPVNATIWQTWLDSGSRPQIYDTIETLIVQVQSGNLKVTEALAPVLTPRYPSQLIQAFLEGLLVIIFLTILWRKPQKPGVIGGWFGVLYCVARIIGEQFRMPDAQIGFQLWGLTRGQWLSIGFVIFALGYLIVAYRRPVTPMGGWNPGDSMAPYLAKAESGKPAKGKRK